MMFFALSNLLAIISTKHYRYAPILYSQSKRGESGTHCNCSAIHTHIIIIINNVDLQKNE